MPKKPAPKAKKASGPARKKSLHPGYLSVAKAMKAKNC